MKIAKEKTDFTNIVGKLVTFRNGERLIVTKYKYHKGMPYGQCHSLFFGSVCKFMNFTDYGTRNHDLASPNDIVNIQGVN